MAEYRQPNNTKSHMLFASSLEYALLPSLLRVNYCTCLYGCCESAGVVVDFPDIVVRV